MKIRQKKYENKSQFTVIKDNKGYNEYKYIDENLDIENIQLASKVILFPKNSFL